MQLQVLGSGDALGSGGRFQACLAVRAGADGLLLVDCGASSLIARSAAAPRRFATGFVELAERRPSTLAGVAVTAYPVVHPSGAPAFALRLQAGGRVLAYSGDTEWTETLLEVARGADLFLCEACYHDTRIPYHLDFRTLERQRGRLECRRLMLTHMSVLARLPLPGAEAAEDGRVVAV